MHVLTVHRGSDLWDNRSKANHKSPPTHIKIRAPLPTLNLLKVPPLPGELMNWMILEWMNEALSNLSTTNIGLYIGLRLWWPKWLLRTPTKMETKGICLCKQATKVEDSSRTIVKSRSSRWLSGPARPATISTDGVSSSSKRLICAIRQEVPQFRPTKSSSFGEEAHRRTANIQSDSCVPFLSRSKYSSETRWTQITASRGPAGGWTDIN